MEAPAPPVKNGDVGDWRLTDADFLASFHLPGLSDKHDRLQQQHPLPRDHRIVFHEAKHEYFCDGVKAPRSVTGHHMQIMSFPPHLGSCVSLVRFRSAPKIDRGDALQNSFDFLACKHIRGETLFLHVCRLLHAYAYDFDPHAAVTAMKGGARWQEKRGSFLTATGTEMKDSEIVEMWRSSGQVASARGTLLHWHAEMYLNGRTVEHPHSPEFSMFLAIFDVLRSWGLRVFRTEVSLFHNGLCLAGQADALFVDDDGAITILDWKRTKMIRFDNSFRTLKEPLSHLPDSNGWLYCLQLNVYKWMIETELTGLRVAAMYLGQVHPCLPRARLIEVPCMRDELQLVVEDQIGRGEAISGALPDATFALPTLKIRSTD